MCTQCFKAAFKGNQVLGMIKRTFTCGSKKIMIPLYKSLARPHLEYCDQAWRPHRIKDIQQASYSKKLNDGYVTRFIDECRSIPYEDRLRTLGLTTLETRRFRRI